MKTCLLFLFFMFFVSLAQSQTATLAPKPTKWEFGAELITVNSWMSTYAGIPDYNLIQPFSGILFRYQLKKRLAIRTGISFNRNFTQSPNRPFCFDCSTREQESNVFRAKAGVQFSLSPKNSLFYAFGDLYYRHMKSIGETFGGFFTSPQNFSVRSNGVGLNAGFGMNIRVIRQFFLNPEAYLDLLVTKNESRSASKTNYSNLIFVNNYNSFNFQPSIRVNAFVKF